MDNKRFEDIARKQNMPIADLSALLKSDLASMISMHAKYEEEFGKRTFGNENSRMRNQMCIDMYREGIEEYKMRLAKLEQNDNKGTRYYFAVGDGSNMYDGLVSAFGSLRMD
jgi:hypothetical protein